MHHRRELPTLIGDAMRNGPGEIAGKATAFEDAMARMASDPAIRAECPTIALEFAPADMDGLKDD
jgi:hypothetical protein